MPLNKSKQSFRLVTVAAAAALSVASAAWAQSVPVSQQESNRLWFVELNGKTVSDGASTAAVQAEQASFRSAAAAARIRYAERRSFSTLFNGFSVDVGPAQRARLAALPGVRAMYPVELIAAPQPIVSDGPAPDMIAALALTRANIAQNTLGLTGAGIKVAIIDSGIDIDHPDFGGTGTPGTTPFPTARITHGWDFVGNAFTGGNTPVPGPNPDDCGTGTSAGHGTHVAGIVGANGAIKGVAPGVSLGAYRVFGCDGSTTADIMVAAMERALADGMHVINMSIGARAQWPQYPTAQAASRLAQKGIVVVASIGNNGPGGSQPDALFAAGAPGLGEHVIGAASFDNAQRSFTAAGTPYGFNAASNSPVAPSIGGLPMSRIGPPAVPPATTGTDACSPLPANSLTGTAVLIQRGSCGFYVKAFNAQNAGALAVVLYNHSAGALNATVAGSPAITIPVVGITLREGTVLNTAIANGPVTLAWTANYVGYPFGTGGLISGFSSFGLGADLSFKPDLGAPGGGILSTYPLEAGGTATLSGTSMSSPHIAGVAALVLQAVPTAALGRTGPVVGRNAPPAINMATRLMNTAVRKNWSGNPDLGLVEHAFRQGAGMVDVVAAVQTEQFVTPGKFSTGESQAGPKLQRLTIRNDSTLPVTYTMGHVAGVAASPNTRAGTVAAPLWGLGGVFDAPAAVGFSVPSVIVPARGMATVDVTVTANAGLQDRSLYGGYVTLTPQGLGMPLQVPFGGLKGDYQTTVHIGVGPQTANPMPWLATTPDGLSFSRCATPCPAFTLTGVATTPSVTVSLAHHARTLKLEAFDQATATPRGLISQDEYVGRATTPRGFFTYAWNGSTSMGVQPNGTYTLRLSALKANGNAANPADWEIWNSPTVTIARP